MANKTVTTSHQLCVSKQDPDNENYHLSYLVILVRVHSDEYDVIVRVNHETYATTLTI